MVDIYDLLPDPAALRRTAVVKYRCGEESYEIFCYAACIRAVEWEDTHESVQWLHCVAALSSERKRTRAAKMMKLLVPVQYITSVEIGPVFRTPRAAQDLNVGVFPPDLPAPSNRLLSAQIDRIIGALQVPVGDRLLAPGTEESKR